MGLVDVWFDVWVVRRAARCGPATHRGLGAV